MKIERNRSLVGSDKFGTMPEDTKSGQSLCRPKIELACLAHSGQ